MRRTPRTLVTFCLLGPALLLSGVLLAGCAPRPQDQSALLATLDLHVDAIRSRNLGAFASTLTTEDTLHLILPDGTVLSTPEEVRALHAEWFADRDWVWEGEVVRTIMGADLATVLMRYRYRDTPDAEPRTSWLLLVFRLEERHWRLVHDQNTRIMAPEIAH